MAPSPEAVSWDKTLRTEVQATELLGVPGLSGHTYEMPHLQQPKTLAFFRALVNMSDFLPLLFPFK